MPEVLKSFGMPEVLKSFGRSEVLKSFGMPEVLKSFGRSRITGPVHALPAHTRAQENFNTQERNSLFTVYSEYNSYLYPEYNSYLYPEYNPRRALSLVITHMQ